MPRHRGGVHHRKKSSETTQPRCDLLDRELVEELQHVDLNNIPHKIEIDTPSEELPPSLRGLNDRLRAQTGAAAMIDIVLGRAACVEVVPGFYDGCLLLYLAILAKTRARNAIPRADLLIAAAARIELARQNISQPTPPLERGSLPVDGARVWNTRRHDVLAAWHGLCSRLNDHIETVAIGVLIMSPSTDRVYLSQVAGVEFSLMQPFEPKTEPKLRNPHC